MEPRRDYVRFLSTRKAGGERLLVGRGRPADAIRLLQGFIEEKALEILRQLR